MFAKARGGREGIPQGYALGGDAGNINCSFSFKTRSLPCLSELHSIFYPNGIKVIPQNIYEMLTPVAGLAHLIMGDGGARPRGLQICTNCYSAQDTID